MVLVFDPFGLSLAHNQVEGPNASDGTGSVEVTSLRTIPCQGYLASVGKLDRSAAGWHGGTCWSAHSFWHAAKLARLDFTKLVQKDLVVSVDVQVAFGGYIVVSLLPVVLLL